MSGASLMSPHLFLPATILDAIAYAGDGNDDRTIGGMSFTPSLLWNFTRTGATIVRRIMDDVRGPTKYFDNTSAAFGDITDANSLQQFLANGFEVGDGSLNLASHTYGSWGFKAGTTLGMTVTGYTGTGSAGATVTHNLGGVPEMIIVRNRSHGRASRVYHKDLNNSVDPWDYFLVMETFALKSAQIENWNDVAPGATVFTVGDGNSTNESGDSLVAHCFRSIPGLSHFGKYTGTGAEQAITGLGFRPSKLLTKIDNGGGGSNESGWRLWDDARVLPKRIRWNDSSAEDTNNQYVKTFDADGFTLGTSNNVNKNGDKYIFGAWK